MNLSVPGDDHLAKTGDELGGYELISVVVRIAPDVRSHCWRSVDGRLNAGVCGGEVAGGRSRRKTEQRGGMSLPFVSWMFRHDHAVTAIVLADAASAGQEAGEVPRDSFH